MSQRKSSLQYSSLRNSSPRSNSSQRGSLKRTGSILKYEGELRDTGFRYKNVGWGSCIVYEFENILGDNPACASGPPLMIAWKHKKREAMDIDVHEFYRQQTPRRSRRNLVLTGGERSTYLLGLGYSLDTVIKATEEAEKIRKSRRNNMKGRLDSFQKIMNKFQATMKNQATARAG